MGNSLRRSIALILVVVQFLVFPVQSFPDEMNSGGAVSVESVVSQVSAIKSGQIADPATQVTSSISQTAVNHDFLQACIDSRSTSGYCLEHEGLRVLEAEYPTGSYYGPDCYYLWRARSVYKGGYGCAGFAYMLSDVVFGDNSAEKIMGNSDVRKYDCIELFNNEHTAFVLSVNLDGTVTVAEGNINGRVIWGSVYNIGDISAVLRR